MEERTQRTTDGLGMPQALRSSSLVTDEELRRILEDEPEPAGHPDGTGTDAPALEIDGRKFTSAAEANTYIVEKAKALNQEATRKLQIINQYMKADLGVEETPAPRAPATPPKPPADPSNAAEQTRYLQEMVAYQNAQIEQLSTRVQEINTTSERKQFVRGILEEGGEALQGKVSEDQLEKEIAEALADGQKFRQLVLRAYGAGSTSPEQAPARTTGSPALSVRKVAPQADVPAGTNVPAAERAAAAKRIQEIAKPGSQILGQISSKELAYDLARAHGLDPSAIFGGR